MKMQKIFSASALVAILLAVTICNGQSTKQKVSAQHIKEETVTYKDKDVSLIGFVAYNSNSNAKRPAILIVPEWWGLTEYAKMRARELAKLGYIAFAVDMYGNGKIAENPDEAGKLAGPFYANPKMAKERFDAALTKLKSYSQVDVNNIAAIGYCFGGGMILNFAKMGENLKGVVSFHGSLAGVPADKKLLKAKILVCHGGNDVMVNKDVPAFRKQMDSIGANYTFKVYPNATHAFTNPDATEIGKKFKMPIVYNKEADVASWADMKAFFGKLFGK